MLNHSIGLLSKIRHYVTKHLLRASYYSLFNSHLIDVFEIWGQNQTNKLFNRLYSYTQTILNLQIFNTMFSLLGIKHTRAATNHFLDINHYGTYSLKSIASVTWNDLLRNTDQNFLDCKIS